MTENSDFTVDQRLRVIKDTVNKMCWSHNVHPKTVKKSAEEILSDETSIMMKIKTEMEEYKTAIEEMTALLEQTKEFCDDLDVEIKKAYDMYGLEMASDAELMGIMGVNSEEKDVTPTVLDQDFSQMDLESKENVSLNIGITFCDPTPAKARPIGAKKLF